MLNFVLQPSFGASLTALAFLALALKFLQPTVRWGIFGGLLTLGLAQAGWLLLGSVSDPLARGGHLAAALGLLWALAVCSMRWRFDEHDRLKDHGLPLQNALFEPINRRDLEGNL